MDTLVKKLRDNPDFKEFQAYVAINVDELNSIDGLSKMTNEQAGEEVKVRAKAVQKLMDILSPFVDFKEKREPTEKEIQEKKEKYGL